MSSSDPGEQRADQPASNRNLRVLLAGGTGYVGSRMREVLRDAGHRVRLLVRSADEAAALREAGWDVAIGDVTRPNSLPSAMDRIDAIINLVAIIREQPGVTFERINYQGTVNLVEAARQAGVERWIQMSALGAGNLPDFPYHYTKWRAENYVKNSGLRWTIFRPSIVFGPSPEGYPQFIEQLADVVRSPAPVVPQIGDGSTRFQPIHHQDVAGCFLSALESNESIGKTYEIAGPGVYTYRQILDQIRSVLDSRKPVVPTPVILVRLGATVLEQIPGIESPVTVDQLRMLQINNVTAHNAAPALLDHDLIPMRGHLDYLVDS